MKKHELKVFEGGALSSQINPTEQTNLADFGVYNTSGKLVFSDEPQQNPQNGVVMICFRDGKPYIYVTMSNDPPKPPADTVGEKPQRDIW